MASKLSALCRLVSRGLTVRSSCSGNWRVYSSKASSNLLNVVKSEILTEQNILESLPTFSLFNLSLEGSIATLSRSYQKEEVKVQLDVGRVSEVDSNEMEFESEFEGDFEAAEKEMHEDEEELQEREPAAAPVFTVSVKNEAGIIVQFDCSLEDFGPYEENIDWNSMRIDSVSVIPSGKGSSESAYYASSSSLSEELYSGLLEFLKERGIDEKFPKEILEFYRVFEHRCYVNDFLGGIKEFLTTK